MSTDVVSADGLTEIFGRVLVSADLDADSDFFSVGGDSLLATRVLSAVARRYGTELTIADFLGASTPRALAARIEAEGAAS